MTIVTNEKSGFVESNGARLHYTMAGSGAPLILIHANVTDQRMWDDQVNAFAQHYQVLRYDMRGYGHSTSGTGSDSHTQDLHALLQALGIERAVLIGCSQGGEMALDFALDQPARVAGLILVSSVPSGYEFAGEPPATLLAFMAAFQRQELEQAAELATQIWFDGPNRRRDQVNAEARAVAHKLLRDALTSGSLSFAPSESAGRPAVDRLTELIVPVLVVVGDQDDPSILEAGEFLATRIPGADKRVVAGAAHLLNLEKPAEFNRIVLDFLGERFT